MPEVYMNGSETTPTDTIFTPEDLGLELSVLLSKMGIAENKVNEIFDIIARVDDPLIEPEPTPEPVEE